jgi:TRAP-type mannitol/chloroaromatic compound transport system substrate-binding protein
MYFFGTHEDNASMLMEAAISASGPGVIEGQLMEMTKEEVMNLLAYIRIGYNNAKSANMPDEVLQILLDKYDKTYEHLASISNEFKAIVASGKHRWLNGYSKENIAKYKKLAGI